jgi:hypothetical protein
VYKKNMPRDAGLLLSLEYHHSGGVHFETWFVNGKSREEILSIAQLMLEKFGSKNDN